MEAGNRYGVTLKQLRELMEYRGWELRENLKEYGGVHEIAFKLNSSENTGLTGEKADLEHRRDVFGANIISNLEDAIEEYEGKLKQTYTLIRSGNASEIQTEEIVVGDIMLVKYGDLMPADGLILESNELKVDESSLTGEADLVQKGINLDPSILARTLIKEGSGKVLVTAVGINVQGAITFQLPEAAAEDKPSTEDKPSKCVCF